MPNISFDWSDTRDLMLEHGIKCKRTLALVPDTDFSTEDDYPVFLYKGKAVVMRIYANDNTGVVSYVNRTQRFVVTMRKLTFLCWAKVLETDYPEYLV